MVTQWHPAAWVAGWAIVADPDAAVAAAASTPVIAGAAAVTGHVVAAADVVRACPALRTHPDLIHTRAGNAGWAAEVVDDVGWHPARWRGMTDADRRRWTEQHGRDVAELDAIAARWPAIPADDRAVLAGLPLSLPEKGDACATCRIIGYARRPAGPGSIPAVPPAYRRRQRAIR